MCIRDWSSDVCSSDRQRPERNAPVAEEDENDQYYQDQGNQNGLGYLSYRLFNEKRIVERNVDPVIGRQLFFQLFKSLIEFLGDVQVIGSRLGNDGQADHGFS